MKSRAGWLVGKAFGRWQVLEYEKGGKYWCLCSCGTKKRVAGSNLTQGRSRSCGCLSSSHSSNFRDLKGQRFDRLSVVALSECKAGVTLWSCLCDCGTSCVVNRGNLISGATRSCGCRRVKLRPLEATQNDLFRKSKVDARCRGLVWELSKETFLELVIAGCHYCGGRPSNCHKSYRRKDAENFLYNGLDRKDNGIGYLFGNVVTCCIRCNKAKGTLGYSEFLRYLKQVAEHYPVLEEKFYAVNES